MGDKSSGDKSSSPEVEAKRPNRSAERREERRRSPGRSGHRDERSMREDRVGRSDSRNDREHNGRREGRDPHERRQDERTREKDRDRDHKRKKESPPYSRDRERRHSPRHPISSKRMRRSDDHEPASFGGDMGGGPAPGPDGGPSRRFRPNQDAARGPRVTGFSMEDPGLGRSARGRPGWPGGRPTGFSDTPYGPGPIPGRGMPGNEGGLKTYKQFMLELEDDILPDEAQKRYEEYKVQYVSNAKRLYFEQHKDEDWMRNSYDPECLEALLEKRNEQAQVVAKEFLEELHAGTVDLAPTAKREAPSVDNPPNPPSDEEGGTPPSHPKSTQKKRLEAAMAAAPKAPPIASSANRIAKDIEQARLLVQKLDGEKGIEENVLTDSWEEEEGAERGENGAQVAKTIAVKGPNSVFSLGGEELLDSLLTYLWRVHSVDYYGAIELKMEPQALRHVRTDASDVEVNESENEAWEAKVDEKWKGRLEAPDPMEASLGRERMESAMAESLETLTRKIKDEKYGWKYGCGAEGCTKLFHGPEFVHKHLKLKHMDVVGSLNAKAREALYLENYMRDPEARVDPSLAGMGRFTMPKDRMDRRGLLRRGQMGMDMMGMDPSMLEERMLLGRLERLDRLPMGPRGERVGLPPSERFGGMRDVEMFDRGMMAIDGERFDPERDPERFERGVPGRRGRGRDRERPTGFDLGPEDYDREGSFERERDPRERFARERERGVGFGPPMMPPFDGPPPFVDGGGPEALYDPFAPPPGVRPPGLGPRLGPPPPPMLIPLNGPLGPFLPAHPEVAMRMMREHGGPPPVGFMPTFFADGDVDDLRFDMGRDDNGGDREDRGRNSRRRGGGRNRGGRGLPPILDTPRPPMMLGLPPMMRHDPRGMRSYKDLDVPEDEVTVIDYRSL